MDAQQEQRANPYGMDEACRNCSELCETRERVVHGYGDVSADFLLIGDSPGQRADEVGVPFWDDEEQLVYDLLDDLGLMADEETDSDPGPPVENVFLTYLARCHHPERVPTDEEVANCEPFLNSELRMINPEIIVPVGQRPLESLAFEYTTKRPDDLDVGRDHATTIRGRGFEIVPMLPPADQTEEDTNAFGAHMGELMGRDYRQTKGRRSR